MLSAKKALQGKAMAALVEESQLLWEYPLNNLTLPLLQSQMKLNLVTAKSLVEGEKSSDISSDGYHLMVQATSLILVRTTSQIHY